MKKAILALVLFGTLLPLVRAQTYKPLRSLESLKTRHFEFIYPKESAQTAAELAVFADSCYEKVSGLLGIHLNERIPVTITPDTDVSNGMSWPVPRFHIILYEKQLKFRFKCEPPKKHYKRFSFIY
jgi:hypothetical protein